MSQTRKEGIFLPQKFLLPGQTDQTCDSGLAATLLLHYILTFLILYQNLKKQVSLFFGQKMFLIAGGPSYFRHILVGYTLLENLYIKD